MTVSADQATVTRRYDRVAGLYDLYNGPMEWLGLAARRRRLLSRAGGRVLEAGVGTGRSLEHYAADTSLVAIDVSPRMLRRARRRAARMGWDVPLEQADVQHLPFADATFDTVVATSLFCSVPDPVRGLAELHRVVKPEGRVLLLEHVRPRSRVLGALADLLSPITRRLFGFDLNRRTEERVRAAGLEMIEVRGRGIWREIVASRRRREEAGDRPRGALEGADPVIGGRGTQDRG